MRKKLRRLMLVFTMVMTSMLVSAQYGFVLNESFESGLPETWTQINHKSGIGTWEIESANLTLPTTAYDGTARIALRNKSNATVGYVTKLITPVLDGIDTLFQPILKFAHASMRRSGDFDILKVYYRTAADQPWVILDSYDSYDLKWKYEVIELPNVTETYQIAFEGTDMMGAGIVLDAIEVRSTPSCLAPANVTASDITTESATLRWTRILDATKYHLKVSSTPIELSEIEAFTADVFDGEIINSGPSANRKDLTGLASGRTYYVYIKSFCATENSEWSMAFMFRTTTLQSIPFTENFDLPINQGFASYLDSWTYGSSEGIRTPYINTSDDSSTSYRYSKDGSFALCFDGDSHAAQESKTYMYTATPKLDVTDISTLQVSFDGYYETAGSFAERRRVIVGVMTDHENISTFVPVDTVEVIQSEAEESFVVPLFGYTGQGKYIALLTQFDEQSNVFYLDNFKVEAIKTIPTAVNISISQKSAKVASFKWFFGNATGSRVAITTSETPPADGDPAIIGTTTPGAHTATNLDPYTNYYIHVCNLNGSTRGDWNTFAFQTPDLIGVIPAGGYSACDKLIYRWNTGVNNAPACNTSLTNERDNGYIYFILGELPNPKDYKVEFEVKNDLSYGAAHKFDYGVIEDIHDLSTYQSLDTTSISMSTTRKKRANLYKYNFTGKFFAIRFATDEYFNKKMFGGHSIISVTADGINICKEPLDINIEPFDTTAKISWEANGASKWEVVLKEEVKLLVPCEDCQGTGQDCGGCWTCWGEDNNCPDCGGTGRVCSNCYYCEGSGNKMSLGMIEKYRDTVTTTSITFGNLKHSYTKHSYTMRALCGDGENLVEGEWTEEQIFLTQCLPKNQVPYIMDFEGYKTGSSTDDDGFALKCWYTIKPATGSEVVLVENCDMGLDWINICDVVYKGEQALKLITVDDFNRTYNQYVALPEFDANVKDLQIRFWMRSANIDSDLEIGVMSDPYDTMPSSYTIIKKVRSFEPNKYEEFIVPLKNYVGNGKYIALRASLKQNVNFYIDNVTVENITCPKVMYPNRDYAATPTTATIGWKKGFEETSWDVVVAKKKTLTVKELDSVFIGTTLDDVVFFGAANSNPFTVSTGLEANTQYYFYVRATCGGSSKGEWCPRVGEFRTACAAQQTNEIGVEDFEGNIADKCWRVGHRDITTAAGVIPTTSSEYAHSGSKSLKIVTEARMNGAYAISPLVDIDNMNKLQVSFWATCTQNYEAVEYKKAIFVGVITDVNDLGTFKVVETVEVYPSEQFFTVKLDKYLGDDDGNKGKYLMFFSDFSINNTIFIDDVRIDTIPDCVYPDGLDIAEITHNSVQFSWSANATPNYTVVVTTAQISANELNADTLAQNPAYVQKIDGITAHSVLVENLNANSEYFAYVAATCNAGDEQTWSPVLRFRTECEPTYSLPFAENFDAYTRIGKRFSPDCWKTYFGAIGEELDYPYIINKGKTKNGLYVYAQNGALSYAAIPAFEEDVKDLVLSFKAKALDVNSSYKFVEPSEGLSRGLVVGVSSDVTTPERMKATFVAVDTIKKAAGAFVEHKVYFNKYQGEGKHFVFVSDTSLLASGPFSTIKGAGVILDDINVEALPACAAPIKVKVLSYSDIDATISWEMVKEGVTKVEVKATTMGTTGDSIVFTEILDMPVTTTTVKNLSGSTQYNVYLRSICGASVDNEWADACSFVTACDKVQIGTIYNFDNLADLSPLGGKKIPNCFSVGNINGIQFASSSAKNYPNVAMSGYYLESRSGDNSLVLDYSAPWNKNEFGGAIVFPLIDEDLDSIQLVFWMRAASVDPYSGELYYNNATNNPGTVLVGTVENPNDMSTFKRVQQVVYPIAQASLATGSYSHVTVDTDLSGENYWVEMKVAIGDVGGKYIVLANQPDGATFQSHNRVFIDDLEIQKISACRPPLTIDIKGTGDAVKVDFTANAKGTEWEYILSSKITFADTIENKVITTKSFRIENLDANTLYYLQMRQNCGTTAAPDWSDWSEVKVTKTVAPLRFSESFNNLVKYPLGWSRYTGDAYLVFNGASLGYVTDAEDYNWGHSTKNLFTDGHAYITSRLDKKAWLVSPTIYIGEDYPTVSLSFDIALTDSGSVNPPAKGDWESVEQGVFHDDKFMVVVSLDGGINWEKANATIWGTEGLEDYNLKKISNTGEKVHIDFTPYRGKQVNIAFVSQSNAKNGAAIDIHLDNVNVNYLYNKDYTSDVCAANDYVDNKFEITAEDITVGENIFKKTVFAKGLVPDTLYTLTLNATDTVTTVFNATICEGSSYTLNNFTASETGVYKQKYLSLAQCDSSVVLNLKVLPSGRYEKRDTICQGQSYEFNGKIYNKTALIIDTITNGSANGCDSILTLHLVVNDRLNVKDKVEVCFGETYEFGGKILTKSGEYTHTFETDGGCDSVVTLTFVVNPKYNHVVARTACKGTNVTEGKFFTGIPADKSKTMTYDRGKSSTGCDSIVTLVLTVVDGGSQDLTINITTDQLPYQYNDGNGHTGKVYDETTTVGTYNETIEVTLDGCEGTINLTLVVSKVVSNDNVVETSFSIVPNPVKVGGEVTLQINDNMNIVSYEVYDNLGALVSKSSVDANPIQIRGFYTRGLHIVRVITSTGEVLTGKVMVQ